MKSLALKSIVVTAAFAATSAFGAETGLPFEKTQFDRTLPNVPQRAAPRQASGERVLVAGTRQDNRATDASQASVGASAAASRSTFAIGVWANDHSFIAPPK
jgi:hypothetical protein